MKAAPIKPNLNRLTSFASALALALGAVSHADSGARAYADSGARAYEDYYPTYAEYCGLSQVLKVPGNGITVRGGRGGHGVIYLKGACRDLSVPYPRIKMCDATDSGERGVGVSVNSNFKNVNWIAVQSRELFFEGFADPASGVTLDSYEKTMQAARELRVMDGVKFHEPKPELLGDRYTGEDYLWQDSFATDFAIRYGRDMYCARVPLREEELSAAVDYLNSRNEKFLRGEEYHWSGFSDNCTHVTHNALAAAGFWPALRIRTNPIFQLFNLAIPYNDWIEALRQGNDLPLEDPLALFRDEFTREALLKSGHLPIRPGVLGSHQAMHSPNGLYESDVQGLILELPIFHPIKREMDRKASQPRYSDIRANLEEFRARILSAKASLRPFGDYVPHPSEDTLPGFDVVDFWKFYQAYVVYLDRALAEVEEKLAR